MRSKIRTCTDYLTAQKILIMPQFTTSFLYHENMGYDQTAHINDSVLRLSWV
jgi:hypothetical protein